MPAIGLDLHLQIVVPVQTLLDRAVGVREAGAGPVEHALDLGPHVGVPGGIGGGHRLQGEDAIGVLVQFEGEIAQGGHGRRGYSTPVEITGTAAMTTRPISRAAR